MSRRKQCAKCPWKVSVDPHRIPNGYSVEMHEALKSTISDGPSLEFSAEFHVFGCHQSKVGAEIPCVGWMANQLGPGNNIALRLACASGNMDADFDLVGEQHQTFEETLP